MGNSKGKQRKQIILSPELPPEITEDEIEVSDEDLQFVDENKDYAGFVSRLDTHSITNSEANGSIAKYQPYASDPSISGALASVLWGLNLLFKHYHPTISTLASTISSMNTVQNQVYLSISPYQAFMNLSLEQESFNPKGSTQKSNNKRKRGTAPLTLASIEPTSIDENEVSKKLFRHLMLLGDIKENETLSAELDRTSSLQLYEGYKKQVR